MGELEKVRADVYNCVRCMVCSAKYNYEQHVLRVCPLWEHSAGFWTNLPGGRNQLALEIFEGRLDVSELPVEAVYECLLCANCRQQCGAIDTATGKPFIDQPAITKALRAELFSAGLAPEGARMFGDNVEKTHNVLGGPVKGRTSWLTPDIKVATDADTVFFPGCLAAYRSPEIAQATAKILNKAGIKFSILGEEEWCCGNPLIMTGQLRLAKKVAKHNVEQLKGKKVITSCAGCARCFKEEYPELLGEGHELNVVHIVELLPELIEFGKIKFKAKKEKEKEIVTYHDPCELGRYRGIYDQPRQVIQSIPGIELVEMVRNREKTWCCGGGGGLKALNFDMAVEIGTDRVKEALDTGAKRIISACPSCKASLKDAIKAMGKEAEIKAIDITELVVEES